MLKLVKWIAYASIAYLLYKFVTDVAADRGGSGGGGEMPTPIGRQSSSRPANMTGRSGQGAFVPVTDSSGTERRAKVGRGVIS
jgi:hypothetical protein